MTELSDYERGKLEGRTEARLDANDKRFDKLNGSVDRHARALETLSKDVRQGFVEVASEIRTMQEEARQRERDVKVAADALAEAEKTRRADAEALRVKRADELAVPTRAWNLRANKATVVSVLVAAAAALYAIHPF